MCRKSKDSDTQSIQFCDRFNGMCSMLGISFPLVEISSVANVTAVKMFFVNYIKYDRCFL